MASKTADSSFRPKVRQGSKDYGDLISKINSLKKKIQAERRMAIREKIERNAKKLDNHIHQILSDTPACLPSIVESGSSEVLSVIMNSTICLFNGFVPGSADKNCPDSHNVTILASSILPPVEKIPPYTTWISLDRNQRMAEEVSVFGSRLIYYDENGDEALICSDGEGENLQMGVEKYGFSEGEDRILWMAFEDHGLNDEVVDIVSQFVGGSCTDIQERYNELKDKSRQGQGEKLCERTTFLDKSLDAASDSLDNLFCRRCLIFDCRLHGCSQTLIFPSEKHQSWSETEDVKKPCSRQCFLVERKDEGKLAEGSKVGSLCHISTTPKKDEAQCNPPSNCEQKLADDGAQTCAEMQVDSQSWAIVPVSQSFTPEKRRARKEESDYFQVANKKKLKVLADLDKESSSRPTVPFEVSDSTARSLGEESCVHCIPLANKNCATVPLATTLHFSNPASTSLHLTRETIGCVAEGSKGSHTMNQSREWKLLEKELFLKGVEIFGRNSCLIARNLLSGMKTCKEVFSYMLNDGAQTYHRTDAVLSSFSEEKEKETPIRSRLTRKRGKARRLKYSSKSSGHPSSWRRIGDGKNKACKQYTPCPCQSMCGQHCPCMENGTCCEKYCGCSKSCKNRFRGCHCAKSQCKSRQCPCFASNRECDPDVCRNCWISCGDGSLGEPPRQSDGQCGNMKLLLRQQQQVLLAKSDVAGWGAFIKNPVNKNDFLGEYTGELISHREADRRGKFYDRVNSSFLFDLNDQWVLDAFRKGDKLKFANHSYNPNCHCKIMLVSGDHRVGIYAKESIEAKEELFYDYCYGPNEAPEWARKRTSSSKDDSSFSLGRARKHQSR